MKCHICKQIAVVKITDIAPETIGKRHPPVDLCVAHFKEGAMKYFHFIEKPGEKSIKQITPDSWWKF